VRKIQYVNQNNVSIEFYLDPFLITALDGLDMATLTLQEQKSPFQDGSVQIDRLFEPREISMTFVTIAPNDFLLINQYKRQIMSVLNPKLGQGTLVYTNDFGSWKTTATAEGPVFANKDYSVPNQSGKLIFYCNDPYWYETVEQSISMQTIGGNLTFPMTFPAGGVTLGTYIQITQSVQNLGDWTTPVKITFQNACTNPKMTKTTTGEYIRLIKTMVAGDVITIDTTPGNKTVYLSSVLGPLAT
jgi:phage-related protein